jgi:DNA-directed RNA polymerase beta subunit
MTTPKFNKWDWETDTWKVWDIYFSQKNVFSKSQVDSFNHFIHNTIPDIVKHYSPIVIEKDSVVKSTKSQSSYSVFFEKIYIGKPVVQEIDDSVKILYPQDARNRSLTYSAPIFVDLKHVIKNGDGSQVVEYEKQIPLCRMPIMVRSNYCNLNGLSDQMIKELGDCQYDNGGYFIVNGSEKVLIPQERISENMPHIRRKFLKDDHGERMYEYYIDIRSSINHAYHPVKSISLRTRKVRANSKNVPFLTNGQRIFVTIPFIKVEVPIFIVFKAFGITNDYDIIKLILPELDELLDNKNHATIDPSKLEMLKMLEGSAQNVFVDDYDEETEERTQMVINTQYKALKYIGNMAESRDSFVKIVGKGDAKLVKIASGILEDEFIPHIGKTSKRKVTYMAYLVRRLLNAVIGTLPIDDRDSLANKRVDNTGALMTKIFSGNFQRLVRLINTAISADYIVKGDSTMSNIKYLRAIIQNSPIESKLKYSLSTGNWQSSKNERKSNSKLGIAQALQRHSYLGTLSHLRRINAPIEQTNSKVIDPRKLHGTQIGYLCVDETPEGQNVGTVKNLTSLAHVTTGSTPVQIYLILNSLKYNVMLREPKLHMVNIKTTDGTSYRYYIHNDIYIKNQEMIDRILDENSCLKQYFDGKWYITGYKIDDHIHSDIDVTMYNEMRFNLIKPMELCNHLDMLNSTVIFVNGVMYGVVNELYSMDVFVYLKMLKRSGKIDIYTSISFDYEYNELHVHTEAGRLVRPCYVTLDLEKTFITKPIRVQSDEITDITETTEPTTKQTRSNKQMFTIDGEEVVILKRDLLEIEKYASKHDLDPVKVSWNDLLTNVYNVTHHLKEMRGSIYDNTTHQVAPLSFNFDNMQIGAIEYLDVYEEKNAVIAFDYKELDINRNNFIRAKYMDDNTNFIRFTHCDLHATAMKGIVAQCIPFSNKNPSPRNIFVSAMAKQPICIPCTNIRQRTDTMANEMLYVRKPIVSTKANKYIHMEKFPYGTQCIVALACYTGYNQEDSVMINKSACDRGLFQSIFYRTYSDTQRGRTATSSNERFIKPNEINTIGAKGKNYSNINEHGMPRRRAIVKGGDVVIGKVIELKQEIDGKKYKDSSTTVRASEEGQIDYVLPTITDDANIFTNNDGNQVIKVRVSRLRQMIIGDKIATRNAQKGTCGMLYNQCDMPFTKDGLVPDIIMNPHAIPSRMTMALLFESVCAKAGVASGRYFDSTAFNEINMNEIYSILRQSGFDEYGDEYLYSGITGRRIKTKIFIGPLYEQRLKHMVDDKIQARDEGRVQMLTRQPTQGKRSGGGLRFGEMERDAIIGYGASQFLKATMMNSSDIYRTYVHKEHGMNIVVNKEKGIFRRGDEDLDSGDIHEIQIPYAMNLFANEIGALGVKLIPRINDSV